MSYVPSTGDQRKEMLKAVGAADYADLYKDVPQEALLNRPLDLPEGMSELEVGSQKRSVPHGAAGRRCL